MDSLNWPFDSQFVLRKKRKLRRELYEDGYLRISKKIAILGGSTTSEIKDMLELFLMNMGIQPEFYESDYDQYWQDVMFTNSELLAFQPDIIYIHTTARNINVYPEISDDIEIVNKKIDDVYNVFFQMWNKIEQDFQCIIIQNNFEKPWYRLMGNKDIYDFHGRSNFIFNLNSKLYEYARTHQNFYIQDIDFLSSCFGLEKWDSPYDWHMYKYAPSLQATPELAYNLANIIKSIYGKNKKAFVLDLDNTLWGGIVGDDGVEKIEIGQETSLGQLYSEFQSYIKAHKQFGILLTIDSKNELKNAVAGLNRPDSILKPDDFLIIKANWDPKDKNLRDIANELNIGVDSLVFVDDNPAERHIVHSQVPDAVVPEIGDPWEYLISLDRSGYFEQTNISRDDLLRNDMYKANLYRKQTESLYADYKDYLLSLEMKAEIKPFSPIYISRIAQLTNKSNQFNLTTRRCSEADIEQIANDPSYITLYGKLEDRFGDNGVVSVVFGHIEETLFHIDLWLMSCRVLKRDMEFAMMDVLVEKCKMKNIQILRGYYFPTPKNSMVKDFYAKQGFSKYSEDRNGNCTWELIIHPNYKKKNNVITIKEQ